MKIEYTKIANSIASMDSTNKTWKDDSALDSSTSFPNVTTYDCYCSGPMCPNNSENCTNAKMCFSSEFQSSDEYIFMQGCLTSRDQMSMLCHSSFSTSETDFYLIECCKGNFCNNSTAKFRADNNKTWLIVGITVGCFLFGVLCFLIMKYLRKSFYKKKYKYYHETMPSGSFTPPANTYRDELKATAAGDSTLREIFSETMSSGSGYGLPYLCQRTLAKDIQREEIIGQGSFGQVWRGKWQDDFVAVKIFLSNNVESWKRECDIYNYVLVPHENILGFYGSDITTFNQTQHWLVMHYHPHGSLFDYLQIYTLDYQELMQILVSTVRGILHLHTEISGVERKPPIAHRDIKTKNILVKNDGTCCIADFGLGVVRVPNTGEINIGTNPRVGTKRYMSPEVLNNTINCEVFDNFRKADIYSLGLVMWECCYRCLSYGVAEEYHLPYGDIVPPDPSIEQMRKVVCLDKSRPPIPERWTNDKILNGMSELIRECWHHNPEARLPAMRIKKNLLKIQDELHISY